MLMLRINFCPKLKTMCKRWQCQQNEDHERYLREQALHNKKTRVWKKCKKVG